jgi:hypothetical protein
MGSKDVTIMYWLSNMMESLSYHISNIMESLSWRVIVITVVILLLLGVGGGFLLLHRNDSPPHISTNTVYPLQQIPIPGPARSMYTDTKYKYNFAYPSEWKASENRFNNVDTVNVSYQVETGPDVRLLDVNCTGNAANWDAQTWWQHHPTGAQIGFTVLKSGTRAFVSVISNQQAEQGYTQYIVVHNHSVCWLAAFTANVANENLIDEIINTFHWN